MGRTSVQAVNIARLQFPAHDRFYVAREVGSPCVHEKPRRFYLQIFAFNPKRPAIISGTLAPPFATNAKIGLGVGGAEQSFESPPLHGLPRIGNRLEDTSWRGRDEDLRQDRVVVRRELSCGHLLSRVDSLAFLGKSLQP